VQSKMNPGDVGQAAANRRRAAGSDRDSPGGGAHGTDQEAAISGEIGGPFGFFVTTPLATDLFG